MIRYRNAGARLRGALCVLIAVWMALGTPFAEVASAATLQVDIGTGTDNPGCATPCQHISYAIGQATPGDIIQVAPGTYNLASGEAFPLMAIDLALVCATPLGCTIDASGTGFSTIEYITQNTFTTSVDGFVLQNDNSSPVYMSLSGGGTLSPVIVNNTITSTGSATPAINAYVYANGSTGTISAFIDNNTVNTVFAEWVMARARAGAGGNAIMQPTLSNNTVTGNGGLNIGGTGYSYGVATLAPIINTNVMTEQMFFWDNAYASGTVNINPTISGNTISGAAGPGMEFYLMCQSSAQANANPQIDNNAITSTGSHGIKIQSTFASICGVAMMPSAIISNNTITGAIHGMLFTMNANFLGGNIGISPTIANNTISGNGGDGIYLLVTANPAAFALSNPQITGNDISGNSQMGLNLNAWGSATLSPQITFNTINNNSWPGIYMGIFDTVTSSPTIGNNTITGNSQGINLHVSSMTSPGAFSPTVSFNTITGNASTGMYMGGYVGVSFSGFNATLNAALSGNTITGSPTALQMLRSGNTLVAAFNIDLGGGLLASPGLNTFKGSTNDIDATTLVYSVSTLKNWFSATPTILGGVVGIGTPNADPLSFAITPNTGADTGGDVFMITANPNTYFVDNVGATPTRVVVDFGATPVVGLLVNTPAGDFIIGNTPAGTGTVDVTVINPAGQQGTIVGGFIYNTVTLPSITTVSIPNGIMNSPYSFNMSASGGTLPYTWSAVGLPPGLLIDVNTGIINGTPLAIGSYPITVSLVDSALNPASQGYGMSIHDLWIISPALPSATQAVAYSTALIGVGGTLPYTWGIINGTLPSGLTLNPATGVISGTPNTQGTYFFDVQLTDTSVPTAFQVQTTYSINVLPGIAVNLPPTAPILVSPADGDVDITSPLVFSWAASVDPESGPVAYDLYLCEGDSSFASCVTPVNPSPIVASLSVSPMDGFASIGAGALGAMMLGLVMVGGALGRRRSIALLMAAMMLMGSALISCSSSSGISSGASTASSKVTIALGGRGSSAIPSNVDSIRILISGDGMNEIESTIEVTGGSVNETFEVPNGTDRKFEAWAYDVNGVPLYYGYAVQDLMGLPTSVSITMGVLGGISYEYTGSLMSGSVYYWKVVATDDDANTVQSLVSSFTAL